jgi:hypothetical protein
MSDTHLDAPLFIKELHEDQIDLTLTPCFYNDAGKPTFLNKPPAGITPLIPAPIDPAIAMGNEYKVPDIMSVKKSQYGIETQLAIPAQEVVFAPLWATREVAAAFGITLVEQGQAVMLSSPVSPLQNIEYEYGVFAGHWSPYQDTGNTLLSVVCTDLEHHDFPHVFASTDTSKPLVVSVGRYWPKLGRIRLADLWVPRGSALYIPPMPDVLGAECIDMHNNRNTAHACWGDIRQNSIRTHTLLQDDGGFFYWYWNAVATVHGKPVGE